MRVAENKGNINNVVTAWWSSEISLIIPCWHMAFSFFFFFFSEEIRRVLSWSAVTHLKSILWDSACRKSVLLNSVDLPFRLTAVFKNGLFMWRKSMKFIPHGKECCLVGSQNAMQRCETTLELFCVSFMFLAFLHALNLQGTSCKKKRVNKSSVMEREGNILILN